MCSILKNKKKGCNRMNKKRLICLLLSLVMVFSVMPLQVFAVIDAQNGETGGGLSTGNTPVSGWWSDTDLMWGVRFSLYFAENATIDTIESSEFTQLGKTKNIVMKKMGNDPVVAINRSVFERMGKNSSLYNGMSNVSEQDPYNYNSIYFSKSAVPAMSSFPTDLLSSNKTSSKTVFNKFFAGVDTSVDLVEYNNSDDTNKEPLDFKNAVEIANFLLGEQGTIPYDKENNIDGFRDGYYYDEQGEKHTGVFKLYYEPFTNFVINRDVYWMTLKDCIAFQNQYKDTIKVVYENGAKGDFFSFFYSIMARLANSVYLSGPEPTLLDCPGNVDKFEFTQDMLKSSRNVREYFKEGAVAYSSMGVGVVTGGIYEPVDLYPKYPSIIKLYSIADGVDENGNLKLKPFMVDGKQYKEVITGEQIQDCYYTNELKALAVNY